jgi:hypothetical protein
MVCVPSLALRVEDMIRRGNVIERKRPELDVLTGLVTGR